MEDNLLIDKNTHTHTHTQQYFLPLHIERNQVGLTLNTVESPEPGSLPSILFQIFKFSGSHFLKSKGVMVGFTINREQKVFKI